jgi:NAD(P)H-dependent flavin oxidoreductase YrpB (nitropropane dioxygenase family)
VKTDLTESLGIEFPIFAFSHCRDVVAAVSRAGGMGVLGAVAFTPEKLEEELQWIDKHVDGKPYGVDVVMPQKFLGKGNAKPPTMAELREQIPEGHQKWLENLLTKYGVPELAKNAESYTELLSWGDEAGRSLVDVALRHPIKLIANALGAPPPDVIEKAHSQGVKVAALIGNVKQALAQKEAGTDIIIASGYEAGGHTGEITTMVLVPQVADAVAPTPVLAAGGIGSGRQMAAALALGAAGVWTGSIWLTSPESEVVPALVEKMLSARSQDTRRSRCITGKPARQLVTDFTKAWEDPECPGYLPMPLQGMLTAEAEHRIRRHAAAGGEGSAQLLGQPVGQMTQVKPAAKIVYDLVEEYIDTVTQMGEVLAAADSD